MLSLLDFDPPREHSLLPFWFWNDNLHPEELIRQIDDFESRGVFGFVLHPRVGLPHDLGWMSDALLACMRLALDEARQRGMQVILYDEGMYPSGSASGHVVARDVGHRCRCLDRIRAGQAVPADATVVAEIPDRHGDRWAIIDRPVDAVIRGLHYRDEAAWSGRPEDEPAEDEPPAADILNPAAVRSFIDLVYERYFSEFGEFFGSTVTGIFTDEPGLLGRCREVGVRPGTTGILDHVHRLLGRDLTAALNGLWDDGEPDAPRVQSDYHRAVRQRTEETYYRQLSDWCAAHRVDLCGHPGQPTDLGQQRWFQVPGQDLVWRSVLPDSPTAVEGRESTQAKCSSSAALHLGRRFNSNECFGAYGQGFDEREMLGLANWCFVRGVNRLYPHAFYYSVRGPRAYERPPDVGPNSPWWDRYRPFARGCQWLCWLNTDSRHVCSVTILGDSNALPWAAARVLFEHQIDFTYLEARHLREEATVDADGLHLAGMHYDVLIVDAQLPPPREVLDPLRPLAAAGRVVTYGAGNSAAEIAASVGAPEPSRSPAQLVEAIRARTGPDLVLAEPEPALRVRHVVKDGVHAWLLANECYRTLHVVAEVPVAGERLLLDPWTGATTPLPRGAELVISPASSVVVQIS
ncbi:MAG: hypothetical protein ACLPVY_24105 [Acidimicrobiia bacterium]